MTNVGNFYLNSVSLSSLPRFRRPLGEVIFPRYFAFLFPFAPNPSQRPSVLLHPSKGYLKEGVFTVDFSAAVSPRLKRFNDKV